MSVVVVYGASGWTGALTAAALDRSGLRLALAGRNRDALERVARGLRGEAQIRVAALDDPRALDAALTGADILVSCAGPYLELGGALVDAALRAGCHYMDATGEHSFLKQVYEYDAEAGRRGVTLCPAFAAKGALGDWSAVALTRTLRVPRIDEVAIAYAHGVREYFRPSPGSVLSAAGQGFLKPRDDYDGSVPVARRFEFPPPFGAGLALLVPGAEDVSIPQHLDVQAVRSYLSLAPGSIVNEPWARLCMACMPWIPAISEALKQGRAGLGAALGSPRLEQQQDGFMVAVEATSGDRSAKLAITTRDAYAVTAEILAYGVRRLLAGEAPRGVVAPARLCDAADALGSLMSGGALQVVRRARCA